MGGIDFNEEITNHIIWNMRLRCFLEGGECISEDKVVSHKDCYLGRWIYSTGLTVYQHIPYMKELEEVHRNLHDVVKQIIRLKNAGDLPAATEKLNDLGKISDRIIKLLTRLEKEVNSLQGCSD